MRADGMEETVAHRLVLTVTTTFVANMGTRPSTQSVRPTKPNVKLDLCLGLRTATVTAQPQITTQPHAIGTEATAVLTLVVHLVTPRTIVRVQQMPKCAKTQRRRTICPTRASALLRLSRISETPTVMVLDLGATTRKLVLGMVAIVVLRHVKTATCLVAATTCLGMNAWIQMQVTTHQGRAPWTSRSIWVMPTAM